MAIRITNTDIISHIFTVMYMINYVLNILATVFFLQLKFNFIVSYQKCIISFLLSSRLQKRNSQTLHGGGRGKQSIRVKAVKVINYFNFYAIHLNVGTNSSVGLGTTPPVYGIRYFLSAVKSDPLITLDPVEAVPKVSLLTGISKSPVCQMDTIYLLLK